MTLPFVVPPAPKASCRVGNNRCGVLEIELLGGLTVGESATISELLAKEQSSFVLGAKIADGIATQEKISISEAFAIIEDSISGKTLEPEAEAIRVRHADSIQEVAALYAHAGQRNMEASVTALVRSRLAQPEWSMEDTRSMDQALFADIWEIVQQEQMAEDNEAEPVTEEELGKPQPEPGKDQKPTGKK